MWEPFGVPPSNSTAYWRSGPNERGTLNILSTCVLTLFLCAYTSLHLNIPDHKKTAWYHKLWFRALGVIFGLVAPEAVALLAFRQWMYARNFEEQMVPHINKLLQNDNLKAANDIEHNAGNVDERDSSGIMPHKDQFKNHAWTRAHSHFALMGGFAFETDNKLPSYFPLERSRLTLTTQGLRHLAQVDPMLIPDISEAYIKDKSKADWFAKALVCMQACWFITQVVGRVATSYPITLLEMNTLLHALCCLVIYLAWWHKPLNIDEPTIIRTTDERTRKICAWMIMSSTLGVSKQLHFTPRHDDKGRRKAYIVYAEDISSDKDQLKTDYGEIVDWTQTDNTQHATCLPRKDDSHSPATAKGKEALVSLSFGQLIHGFRLVSYSKQWSKTEKRPPDDAHVLLTPAEVECLRLASLLRAEDPVWNFSAIVRLPLSLGSIVTHVSEVDEYRYAFSWAKHDDSVLFGFRGSTSLTQRFKKHASRFVWGNLLFGGAVYGSIHLVAWNGPFTMMHERWLWRVSCLVVASPLPLAVLIIGSFKIAGYLYVKDFTLVRWLTAPLWLPIKGIRWVSKLGHFGWEPAWILVSVLFCLAYGAARFYLIIECFINLAHLPPAVYHEPEWSQFLPHFGAG